MPARPRRSPSRWLAPAALVACAVAVIAVVQAGRNHDASSKSAQPTQSSTPTKKTPASQPKAPQASRTYTVKEGDTLSAIAVSTGVDLETIQRLNPDLDAQTLHAGQKVKLAP